MTKPRAAIAPVVERTLGKGEVACSNHASSTIILISLQCAFNMITDQMTHPVHGPWGCDGIVYMECTTDGELVPL